MKRLLLAILLATLLAIAVTVPGHSGVTPTVGLWEARPEQNAACHQQFGNNSTCWEWCNLVNGQAYGTDEVCCFNGSPSEGASIWSCQNWLNGSGGN